MSDLSNSLHLPNFDHLDRECGMAIGWDFGRFNMALPEGAPDFMRDSAGAAKIHFGSRVKPAGRYERKWLRLRYNAWLRDRLVGPDVTPDLIRAIDEPFCPVSRVRLTNSVHTPETNWSIDRLTNDASYAEGNLAVVSTRVNLAKGRKGLQELLDLSNGKTSNPALSLIEWQRLTCIVHMASQGVHGSPDTTPFLLKMFIWPPRRIFFCNPGIILQYITTLMALRDDMRDRNSGYARLSAASRGKAESRAFATYFQYLQRLAIRAIITGERVAKECGDPADVHVTWGMEDAWVDPLLWRYFEDWLKELMTRGRLLLMSDTARQILGVKASKDVHEEVLAERWSLATHGYRNAKPDHTPSPSVVPIMEDSTPSHPDGDAG